WTSGIETQAVPRMVQFGEHTNWQAVINEFHRSFVLLRRDGTLWHWGTNDSNTRYVWPGLKALTPLQIGRDSDWARIVRGPWNFYAWKKDGTAWNFTPADWSETNRAVPAAAHLMQQRRPFLDNSEWRAFKAGPPWYLIGLRADGTLWSWKTENVDLV